MPDEIYITHLNSKYILQISENNFFLIYLCKMFYEQTKFYKLIWGSKWEVSHPKWEMFNKHIPDPKSFLV